jgi:hypothetical protein
MKKKHAVHPQPKEAPSELEKECQAILDLLTQEEDEHWQIGVHYNRIVDGRLAQAEGFKSAKEFFSQRLTTISQSTLSLYGAIAKAFSEELARKYGSSLLDFLIAYVRLAKTTLPQGDPGQFTIKVPTKNGSTSSKPFADCSAAELRSAVHALYPPPKRKPIPSQDKDIITALAKGLNNVGDGNPITMRARRVKADTMVTFNLPLVFLEYLRDVLIAVVGKPDFAASRRHKKAHFTSVSKNGRAWSHRNGGANASRPHLTSAKRIHHPVGAKMKQMPHRNGKHARP